MVTYSRVNYYRANEQYDLLTDGQLFEKSQREMMNHKLGYLGYMFLCNIPCIIMTAITSWVIYRGTSINVAFGTVIQDVDINLLHVKSTLFIIFSLITLGLAIIMGVVLEVFQAQITTGKKRKS